VSCRDFPLRAKSEEEAATVLFVGFFRHEPNVEAVLYFVREVLPLLRRQIPGARFRVVGAYPPPSLKELAEQDSGIEITGMVDDIAIQYRRATVFVAPILRGSGTRLKILEAMASGCPVVSTAIGAEGLGAGPGEIRIADDAAGMAAALAQLLENPSERSEISAGARQFVAERFDWPAIGERLIRAYRDGLARVEGRGPDALGERAREAASDAAGARP
jgi:glycosyltransferase involved in cell wall biosynthesis